MGGGAVTDEERRRNEARADGNGEYCGPFTESAVAGEGEGTEIRLSVGLGDFAGANGRSVGDCD